MPGGNSLKNQEAQKGNILKGDIWKEDFAVKVALDKSILNALFFDGKRRLDRESVV